jgi:hypothetical protein
MADQKQPQQSDPKSTALAVAAFDPANLGEAIQLSELLAKSSLLPDALRAKPSDVLVQVMTGRELGLSPMQSIRSMSVINGTPVMKSELMVALVKKSPECIFFRLIESTDKIAVYSTHRRGEEPVRLSFTIDQANAAGLVRKNRDGTPGTWMKFPAALLRARAASHLARAIYPDVLLGVTEEAEAEEAGHQVPPAMTQAPAREQVIEGQVVRQARPVEPTAAAPQAAAAAPKPDAVDVPWEPEAEKTDVSALLAKISGAGSQAELEQLLPDCAKAPKEALGELRTAYKARKAALAPKAAAVEWMQQQDAAEASAPAQEAAPEVEREPGSEG